MLLQKYEQEGGGGQRGEGGVRTLKYMDGSPPSKTNLFSVFVRDAYVHISNMYLLCVLHTLQLAANMGRSE